MNDLIQKKKIVKFLKDKNLLETTFKFSCYTENMWIYTIENDEIEVDLSIICDNSQDFLSEMSIQELFDLKGKQYIELRSCGTVITYNINEFIN